MFFPSHLRIHPTSLLLHLTNPPSRQLLILLLQPLLLLLRHIQLQIQRDHLVLHLLYKPTLALQLLCPVLASPLKLRSVLLELGNALLLLRV